MRLSFIALAALLFSSCQQKDDCSGSCDPINPEIAFMIKNNAGKNLVSGPDKIYNFDQIKVKYQFGGGLVEAPLYFNNSDTSSISTGLFFVSGNADKYFLLIDNVVTDSMEVTYVAGNPPRGACCPSYKSITGLKLNTVSTGYVFPNSTGTITIIK